MGGRRRSSRTGVLIRCLDSLRDGLVHALLVIGQASAAGIGLSDGLDDTGPARRGVVDAALGLEVLLRVAALLAALGVAVSHEV